MVLDHNGYPTEDALEQIEKFNLGKHITNLPDLFRLIRNHWWAADWGFKYHPDTGCLELHTGGWSGNECVIMALKTQQWFWSYYWEKSTRGGHYWFKLWQFDENGKQCLPKLNKEDLE
jgi:hypothetical protein